MKMLNNENLIEQTQLQDEQYEVADKDNWNPVISLRNSNYLKNFNYLWKKLIKTRVCYSIRCNGQTPSQNSISGNSSISVINILNDRISFLENELFKKDTIIDYLLNDSQKKWKKSFRFLWVWSNELITSIRSKSQDSTDSSRSANTSESITMDKYANETIKETTNENEK